MKIMHDKESNSRNLLKTKVKRPSEHNNVKEKINFNTGKKKYTENANLKKSIQNKELKESKGKKDIEEEKKNNQMKSINNNSVYNEGYIPYSCINQLEKNDMSFEELKE